MNQSKQTENEDDLPITYSFRYDDLLGRFGGSLQLLTATFSDNIYLLTAGLIAEAIAKLCAYEYVEHDAEYKKRFNEIIGEEVTRVKVQRWLLGCLIYEIQVCLTIELSHGESDAYQHDFAPELTRAVKSDKKGYLFNEPIDRLNQELLSIAIQNPTVLSDEINSRQQIAAAAIARIIPFRLSALLIGLFSNALIGAMSNPALPDLVEEVERGFLPSLKLTLLPTRGPGGSDPHYDTSALLKHYENTSLQVRKAKRTYKTHHKSNNWAEHVKLDVPGMPNDLISRLPGSPAGLSNNLTEKIAEKGAEIGTPAHIAYEWAARLCGVPDYYYSISNLEKIARQQRNKVRV